MKKLLPLLVIVGTLVSPASAQESNVFYGGGIGLSFGAVDYVEIAPMVGIDITDDFSTGVNLIYRYRNDSRYQPSLSTSDYGGGIFARYDILTNVFAQTEYEYLNFEYYDIAGHKVSDTYSSFLVGGGFSQPAGSNARLNAVVLYNLSYSENDFYRPYDSPWVVRIGIAVGF